LFLIIYLSDFICKKILIFAERIYRTETKKDET